MSDFPCPGCGQPYTSSEARLLAERDGLYFVDLDCRSCGSRTVAIVTLELDDGESDLLAPGMTVARPHPERPQLDNPPITADDVLEMHEFLAGFRGDVRELFRAAAGPLRRGAERG